MGVFINIPIGLEDGKYFHSEDGLDDVGIYKVGRYENSENRHVYITSVTIVKVAEDLCNKLNEGKMFEDDLFKYTE